MQQCNTEELYLLYKQRLLGLIQSKVQDTQQAEDLLHDSFMKLQSCCANNCECERPKSYLFRLVLNTVFDFFKKRKKENLSNGNADSIIEQTAASAPKASSCDLIQCISGFLGELTPENRTAYELVDLQQQSQVEVAQQLQIPLTTLKSRVQRTRKFLKGKLEQCCPDYTLDCE